MIASTQTNHPLAGANAGLTQPPLLLACKQLKRAGLRITQPRVAILTALIRRGYPTSIEQLHRDLAEGSCDLVTVYRCVAAFEQIALVRRSFSHNGTSLYLLNLSGTSSYHFLCKDTNHVEEIDPDVTAEVRRCVLRIEDMLRARGYTDLSHVVEFFGRTPQPVGTAASAAVHEGSAEECAAPIPQVS